MVSALADWGLADSLFRSLMAFLRSSLDPDFTVLKRVAIDSPETAGVEPMRLFIQVDEGIHVIVIFLEPATSTRNSALRQLHYTNTLFIQVNNEAGFEKVGGGSPGGGGPPAFVILIVLGS